jgi:hypothetical protein
MILRLYIMDLLKFLAAILIIYLLFFKKKKRKSPKFMLQALSKLHQRMDC